MLYTLLEYIKTTICNGCQFRPVLIGWATRCSGLEGHVLVGAEESHELWHLDDLDASTLVDIEVSPGLGEVGVKVSLLGSSGESLMGFENLGRSSSGGGLGHDEVTRWGSIIVLLLVSISLLHRSHEDVIGILRESGVWLSLVRAINLTVLAWGEDLAGVVIIITVASEGDSVGKTEESDNSKCEFHSFSFF